MRSCARAVLYLSKYAGFLQLEKNGCVSTAARLLSLTRKASHVPAKKHRTVRSNRPPANAGLVVLGAPRYVRIANTRAQRRAKRAKNVQVTFVRFLVWGDDPKSTLPCISIFKNGYVAYEMPQLIEVVTKKVHTHKNEKENSPNAKCRSSVDRKMQQLSRSKTVTAQWTWWKREGCPSGPRSAEVECGRPYDLPLPADSRRRRGGGKKKAPNSKSRCF